MRHLAFASLALSAAALAASTACKQENTGYCPNGICIDAAGIDAPPMMCDTPGIDLDCPSTDPVCGANGFCGPCTMDEQCDGRGDVVCGGGACVECDEEGVQADPPGGGEDECQMAGQQVCDATTQMCRACTQGSECASDVCDNGTCVPELMVAYVEMNGPGNMCTDEEPCDKVSEAIGTGRPFILVRPGTYSTNTEIDFNDQSRTVYAHSATLARSMMGSIVTVRGESQVRFVGATFNADGDGGNPVIITTSGTSLTLIESTVMEGDRNGIQAQGNLTIHDSIVRNNQVGIAIDDSNSDLEVLRTAIHNNAHAAIRVTSSRRLRIANNIIYANGTSTVAASAIQVTSLSEAGMSQVSFNTIVDNTAGAASQGAAISCPTNELTVNNSIFWGNAGTTQIQNCTIKFSTVQGLTPSAVDGILNDAPTFAASPPYHLATTSVLKEKADPNTALTGILEFDFDMDERPQGGTRADLGADEIP
jgi:hypothetical protein